MEEKQAGPSSTARVRDNPCNPAFAVDEPKPWPPIDGIGWDGCDPSPTATLAFHQTLLPAKLLWKLYALRRGWAASPRCVNC